MRRHLAVFLLIIVGASCRTGGNASAPRVATTPPAPSAPAGGGSAPIVQPGAPGQAPRVIAPGTAAALPQPTYTDADVKFMQGMIAHHLQAIDMVNLLKTRTASDDMKKLGLRMELSQADEIKMMQRWLEVRGQEVPGPHAHHTGMMMPGMLTAEEMARLEAAKGTEFDRLFLQGMIKHHGGALIMVDDLFKTPGAGQDSDIYAFASDVVADQRMEIDRMAAMLNALPKER
ncbi:MAG TPA: DUF305 domain-containing protein [Vicinamibacterales bacterium]|nr:DUF305 domain-containing protein [Vicinamibacterales bacterium]